MSHWQRVLLVAMVVLPLAGVQADEEQVIELDQVPEELLEIARERVPDVEFVSANTEGQGDEGMVYEIQGVMADGRRIEFDIFPDGRIDEIEIEFSPDMVPGAVMQAIEARLPGFEPTFIEASHSPSLQVVGYEFVGTMGDAEMDIEVSADGRQIVVADQ